MITTMFLDAIVVSKTNPRKHFHADDLADLTESVRQHGVLQPVLVRPVGAKFELVAGERRVRAAKAAGLKEVPALVRELTDTQVIEVQVIENLQRADLHPLEEAAGYARLMDIGLYDVERLAERIGRSPSYIYDRLKLLNLTEPLQALFVAGRIQVGHAVILARLSPAEQTAAAHPQTGGLFTGEATLWDPREDERDDSDPFAGMKTRSVKELQAWVDGHVKFSVDAVDQRLFPETAQQVSEAQEQKLRVIPITLSGYVQPEARDGSRVWGPRSWKRADGQDGSKRCEYAAVGVLVVGPGRGESFPVCVEKKRCRTHWGAEQQAAKRRAAASASGGARGQEKWEREQQAQRREEALREAKRAAWRKALPTIRTALKSGVEKASPSATGPLAEIVYSRCLSYGVTRKSVESLLPIGKTAEDALRAAAMMALFSELGAWRANETMPKVAKALGVDVVSLVEPVPVCRRCGCLESMACQTPDGPCTWSEPPTKGNRGRGLCSACVKPGTEAKKEPAKPAKKRKRLKRA